MSSAPYDREVGPFQGIGFKCGACGSETGTIVIGNLQSTALAIRDALEEAIQFMEGFEDDADTNPGVADQLKRFRALVAKSKRKT